MLKILKRLPISATLAVLFTCIFHVKAVISGIQTALHLCAVSIIPSLFLFLVLSDLILSILLSYDRILFPKILVYLLGMLCGFPTGAILCDRLHREGILCEQDAEQLLPLCNSASPAFVIGAVGSAMLGDIRLGALLYGAQIVATLPFLLPRRRQSENLQLKPEDFSLASLFFSSVEKSIGAILRICALICLFSAILSVLQVYCTDTVYAFLAAFLEIGNGASNAAALYPSAPTQAMLLLAIVCGWSGVCVHGQILSAAKSIKVNYFHFALKKGCVALLTAVLTAVGYKMFFCT